MFRRMRQPFFETGILHRVVMPSADDPNNLAAGAASLVIAGAVHKQGRRTKWALSADHKLTGVRILSILAASMA
jgi:hypothetical protein